MSDGKWRELNRANWDERVAVHLAAPGYEHAPLLAGRARSNAIEEAELGPIDGLRLLHLQCHFGRDTLILAMRGATVVGLDFSPAAITAARELTAEPGFTDRARFVEADLYDAPNAIPEPGSFDLVYVTWGALCWLPDVAGWARIVAHFLKPGGSLYLAEGHPAALLLDDAAPQADGLPGFFVPYFHAEPWSSTTRPITPTRRRGSPTASPMNGSIRWAPSSRR
jgi:SAM-dependent methyltransferase